MAMRIGAKREGLTKSRPSIDSIKVPAVSKIWMLLPLVPALVNSWATRNNLFTGSNTTV